MGIQPRALRREAISRPQRVPRRFTRRRNVCESRPLVQEQQHRLGRSARGDCVVAKPKDFHPGGLFVAVRHPVHIPGHRDFGQGTGLLAKLSDKHSNNRARDRDEWLRGAPSACHQPWSADLHRVSRDRADTDDYALGSIVPYCSAQHAGCGGRGIRSKHQESLGA